MFDSWLMPQLKASTPAHTHIAGERRRTRGRGRSWEDSRVKACVVGGREIKNRDEDLGMVVLAFHPALRRLR